MRSLALAAALTAAVFLPGARLGLAVPVVGGLMLAAASVALRASGVRIALGVLALSLAAQAALLDASWVVALDLIAAWLLASLAVSGVALEALVAPAAGLRRAPALMPQPSERRKPAFRGVGIGTVVVLPFLLLFLSADAAFAGLAGDLPLPSGDSLPGRVGVLVVVLAATLGLGLAARSPLKHWVSFPGRGLSFAEWAIPLALLDLLFVAFVTVQLAVLFGGRDRVLATEGLTYAEYARSGFWQLLAVSALTFAVLGSALIYARTSSRRESVVLRLLLVGLCALALVVVVSALRRLGIYEDTFGLTRLRLLVETTELWLGMLLILVAAAVLAPAARRRLAPAAVLATSIGLLAFSLNDPDRRIAERNVERWSNSGAIDLDYLAGLSADATPALLALPARQRESATFRIRERVADGDSLGSFNRSRTRARDLLEP